MDPVLAKAMDVILIIHADHEQNMSTSTVRTAGSSLANPFACIASGIASLWGPAHGGANEAVILMLEEIGSAENIPKYIAKAKDHDDPFRLMGFGHRVYKNFDPRAKVMQALCHKVWCRWLPRRCAPQPCVPVPCRKGNSFFFQGFRTHFGHISSGIWKQGPTMTNQPDSGLCPGCCLFTLSETCCHFIQK